MDPPIGNDGKVLLNFENEFNPVIRRCLAKIAFNYLAFVAGDEFVLQSQFDSVRSFIRYGTEATDGIVYFRSRPILAQEILTGTRITNGHIITVEGKPSECVQSQLSLFNSFRYRIVLAPSHSGIYFAKGHHFDLASRGVSELLATQSSVVSC